ncbi:hypothetical protein A2625_06885 [candidate division WOR-1 bacterium RIFCSPHIGHO2_01_FULL_53_15]|uniref:Uncharacterized protein n=1 Tax=candidate division WOR-1 bacterium RIFCSPHIGHO2_01_FULL_53_15 TaxID=1802564 RepID=A0A1F4Q594_UNCSA|nr:MAG: hypothetical protein A2625_06885 [candidate division WOR-1 bacterium RIFCSPHIGHO2_01_FULL_53_15]OGC10334.1 MAG: hypothetical protein A3D23_06930 [candidate division WOR-1 bacterium RIFCSPHIGHO2_02_FULL_53_26]
MKNFKFLIYLFLSAFFGLIILSGFCLAMEKHSCCQPKASDCPILSVQDAASPEAVKSIQKPDTKSAPAAKPLKDKSVAPSEHKHSEVPDFRLPNYHLSAKISHQTTAPPRA